MEQLAFSWNGHVDWRALRGWEQVFVRRIADRGEWLIGVGSASEARMDPWQGELPCIGYAGYGTHGGQSGQAPDGFATSAWWTPRILVRLAGGRAALWAERAAIEEGRRLVDALCREPDPPGAVPGASWERDTSKEQYLERAHRILELIRRGELHEVNYCTRRTARWPGLDPWTAFARLLDYTDAPHAAFLRRGNQFALCASPERFVRVEEGRITTQPMKGTRPRGRNEAEDRALAEELAADPKERRENVLAVEVAREDLIKIAVPGSVQVDELCGVKTFRNVHQMVSTLSAGLRPDLGPADILRATFPMASMTGSPKQRAVQLIAEVEDMPRGLYSGAIGYFLPDGTADLNVVIRTITWDAATGIASLITGGAITAVCDPLRELEECDHKARSVLNAFGHVC